jgi:phage/conjugal plasmid C-4 type zinc finger TraR family protein
MAKGWGKDDAVQEQIDASVDAAVSHARKNLPSGASLSCCEACGVEIPQARRDALPGVRRCVPCQAKQDSRPQ